MDADAILTPFPPDDQLHKNWSDPIWLKQNPLCSETALDYFYGSEFCDHLCINIRARSEEYSPEQLSSMPGFDYALAFGQCVSDRPALFIIERRHRYKQGGPQSVTAVYYILNGIIYRAPDTYSVFSSCLVQACHNLQDGAAMVAKHKVFCPSNGYSWDFLPVVEPTEMPVAKRARTSSSIVADNVATNRLIGEMHKKVMASIE